MNRRELILAAAAATWSGISAAKEQEIVAAHVIRLGFAKDISPELRAHHLLTFNRFKQIKAPRLMVVGRNVAIGSDEFEYAQISTFASESKYREYFYDPIHLEADREADSDTMHSVNRGESFDVYPHWTESLAARLSAMKNERTARYQARDDRPTSPPVADRPQDQHWNFGRAFFYAAQFRLASTPDALTRAYSAVRERTRHHVVAAGRDTLSAPQGKESYGLIVRMESEAAYQNFKSGNDWKAAHAAGLFSPEIYRGWFVIAPADLDLASRLRAGES